MAKYNRILLKLSGEVLAGQNSLGIDPEKVQSLAVQVASVARTGIQLALVIGGGNFFRGVAAAARNMDRVVADQMGMLATVINALAFGDALEKQGIPTRVLTAVEMNRVAEFYTARAAAAHLEAGRVIICAGGTGNPYFSTDTGASLRALEIKACALAKATRVDGVYDKDPLKHADAKKFDRISHQEVLDRGLAVIDGSAVAMCRDNGLPIQVFNLNTDGNIMRMAMGEPVGSIIG